MPLFPRAPRHLKRADQTDPTGGASPTDYGWKFSQNCFEPDWYPGSSVPESLTGPHEDDGDGVEDNSVDEESDNAWSEDSDESDESDREDL